MKSLSILSLLILSSCASTSSMAPDRLSEPGRTMNFISCLQGGLPVTVCTCVENKMLSKFGSEEKALKFGYSKENILMPMVEECLTQVMPELSGEGVM